jgi:hypothetical protein
MPRPGRSHPSDAATLQRNLSVVQLALPKKRIPLYHVSLRMQNGIFACAILAQFQ